MTDTELDQQRQVLDEQRPAIASAAETQRLADALSLAFHLADVNAFDRVCRAYQLDAATEAVALKGAVFSLLADRIKQQQKSQPLTAPDPRLAAQAAEIAALKTDIVMLKDAIAERSAPVMIIAKDAGVWRRRHTYTLGDTVSWSGSGWICHVAHTSDETIDHGKFRLYEKGH